MRKIIPSGVVECQIGPRRSVRSLLAAKIKKHKQKFACAFLAEKERLEMPHQKYSRIARLEHFALLLISSPHRLASSAAGSASSVRPAPSRRSVQLSLSAKEKSTSRNLLVLFCIRATKRYIFKVRTSKRYTSKSRDLSS